MGFPTAALISYPAGFLSDKWGRRNVLLVAFIIFIIAYVGFAVTRSIPLIAALFAGYGLYQGIFRSVGKAFAADFVPEALRSSGIGWYNTTVGLLGLVASVVAGLLRDHVSHVGGVCLRRSFCRHRQRRLADLAPGKASSTRFVMWLLAPL